jgi:hypothetical protein
LGGKDPNRQPRLTSLRNTPQGWLRVATCRACGSRATLPTAALIRKHGELALVELALVRLQCSACGGYGADEGLVRLCEPECPRRMIGGTRTFRDSFQRRGLGLAA